MTDKLSERLEREAARTKPAWTSTPTMDPPTKPVHDARVQALLREAAELARRVEWQPIETAPRDGTWIAVRLPFHDDPAVARWAHSRQQWETHADAVDVLTCGHCGGSTVLSTEPTLWTALPEPPEVG